MKLRPVLFTLFALATAFALRAAEALPVFNAALTVGRDHRFVLVGADGTSSGFLSIGQSFAGYRLKAYDPQGPALDVERDGKVTRLALADDAKVKHADATPVRGTLADAEAVLNAMNYEQMMEKTMASARRQQGTMVDRMMGQMLPAGADRDAAVAFQKRMMDEIMSAKNFSEMKGEMTKVYSEVFTKDQLAALGSFYQSPAGQALSDKQPEIAEKMSALMMPRMMAMMPKIQQMVKDFAQEQKAKAAAPVPKQ